jgi:hypothetical protein
VLTDLAVMLADGGACLSDLAALRDQLEWCVEQVVKLSPMKRFPTRSSGTCHAHV